MTKINRSFLVSFSAEQMYELVNGVDKYPEFLPWCSKTDIHHVCDKEMRATIHFSHGIVSKSFTTQNNLEANKLIHMTLLEGPFKQFEGKWTFEEQSPKTCLLSFDLEFEFNSPLLAMAAGPIFQQATSSMIEAFIHRAGDLYE